MYLQQIEKENPQQGLYAVVLNAGVGRGGVVDWMPLEEYRSIMEVNFFSVVAVVKACLPLLKQAKGRIVNVTSFAGLFHGAPCMSAYCASKHASEAFTTSLRLEIKGWGIKVSNYIGAENEGGRKDNCTETHLSHLRPTQ